MSQLENLLIGKLSLFYGITAMFTLHGVLSRVVITECIIIFTVSLSGEGSWYARVCVCVCVIGNFHTSDYFCTNAFLCALNFFS